MVEILAPGRDVLLVRLVLRGLTRAVRVEDETGEGMMVPQAFPVDCLVEMVRAACLGLACWE